MITFAVIGGLLLNVGAYLTLKGKIYEAVIVYLFADVCWIAVAYERGDFLGTLFTVAGVIFGFLAFWKMKNGEMSKNLNGEKDDL
ncbi:hypothetical protein [Sulfurimonas sp.]|uniref:hypothetical protein n=1 Tax=Sulfurimonas sp. TaxID=2022749 RepID=UPI0025DCD6EA|nr:hypothetical protein [Sulfurimonas sp.]MDD5156566.1 hypothetical protein [Sulfurimonas sp.]